MPWTPDSLGDLWGHVARQAAARGDHAAAARARAAAGQARAAAAPLDPRYTQLTLDGLSADPDPDRPGGVMLAASR